MKKAILVILLSLICVSAYSEEIMLFKTKRFCMQEKDSNGNWPGFSPWEDSDLKIVVDLTTDVVTIYSPRKQVYQITDSLGEYTDSDGETTAKLRFVDQDGDLGDMRLMMRNSGKTEIYIDFNNIMWVYEVELIE